MLLANFFSARCVHLTRRKLPMLIPDGFQCLVVLHRNVLGEFGSIRSLWVASCEFGCTPCLLNREVSTWLHLVTSLSPRTGVYVLCTLLFRCIKYSRCIRVQAIFFADGTLYSLFLISSLSSSVIPNKCPPIPFIFSTNILPFLTSYLLYPPFFQSISNYLILLPNSSNFFVPLSPNHNLFISIHPSSSQTSPYQFFHVSHLSSHHFPHLKIMWSLSSSSPHSHSLFPPPISPSPHIPMIRSPTDQHSTHPSSPIMTQFPFSSYPEIFLSLSLLFPIFSPSPTFFLFSSTFLLLPPASISYSLLSFSPHSFFGQLIHFFIFLNSYMTRHPFYPYLPSLLH